MKLNIIPQNSDHSLIICCFTSILILHAQAQGICSLKSQISLEVGRMLTSSRSERFSTFTVIQCHDLCYRRAGCKGFMFEKKDDRPNSKMFCTLHFKEIRATEPKFCGHPACFISGEVNRTRFYGPC